MKTGKLKQLLLITDGCSNQGENPVGVARKAREKGITVNVIGIMDAASKDHGGIHEVEEIARSGGGMSRIVQLEELSQTVQMVTRQAMSETIKGVINQELQQILGDEASVETLHPEKRDQIVEVIDDLGESIHLDLCVLVDASASMKPKLKEVEEALTDLTLSLSSREGSNNYCLYSFPGKRKTTECLLKWTPQFSRFHRYFNKLSPSGLTPTGPALQEVMLSFEEDHREGELSEYDSLPYSSDTDFTEWNENIR